MPENPTSKQKKFIQAVAGGMKPKSGSLTEEAAKKMAEEFKRQSQYGPSSGKRGMDIKKQQAK